jgi:uncharacterized protein (DUF1697 family)
MNCKMSALAEALGQAGLRDVKTVLASGNVVFSAKGTSRHLEKKCEAAMQEHLGRSFMTFVRPVDELQALLAADPFARERLPAGAKKIVTFLHGAPEDPPRLPIAKDDARILSLQGREVFSAYVPTGDGPAFMALIERTFGNAVTTRTWDTVRKVCAAA